MSPIRELRLQGTSWMPLYGGNMSIEPPISSFVLGETKPGAGNTGLNVNGVTAAQLITVPGNVTYSTNDTTVERRRFTGKVSITGKNITFRDCWFNSGIFGSAMVQCTNANVENITFENCLFRPPAPGTAGEANVTNYGANLVGDRFTMIRCDLSWACDGINIASSGNNSRDVTILGSYFHDLTYFSPYILQDMSVSWADNQTHNDCIQVTTPALTRFRLEGCTLECMFDPAVGNASQPPTFDGEGNLASGNIYYPNIQGMGVFMTGSGSRAMSDIVVHKNWMYGSATYVNWGNGTTGSGNLLFTDNRWLRGQRLGDSFTLMMRQSEYNKMTVTGNYYLDTGEQWNGRKAS